jgi:hypothetical protein
MPGNTPLINGTSYAWANISFILFNVPVVGITAINYKRKQKKDNNYGKGYRPVGRGYGNEEYEGDIEVYLETWQAIVAAAPGANPLQVSPFDIPVLFSGDTVVVTKHILRSVEFLEDPMESKQGDTKILCKIPLIIGDINKQ